MASSDVLILSAGSSVSTRDMTAQVVEGLGEPGVLVHGVSLKPGKPTILGVCADKPVFGLPGNPVSCMVTFDLFVAPILAHLDSYADNATLLYRILCALSAAAEEHPVRAATARRLWCRAVIRAMKSIWCWRKASTSPIAMTSWHPMH